MRKKTGKAYYNYAALRKASIFDLSTNELQERLRPAAEKMVRETFAKGGYITYYDPVYCPTTKHMVHEYQDRKELYYINENFESRFLRLLWSASED